MEKEHFSSGFAHTGDDAPDSYRVAQRSDNPNPVVSPATAASTEPTVAAVPSGTVVPGSDGKKKRGRPRKYGPDGKATMPLSPMPISASIPLSGEYSAWKRGRGKPSESTKRSSKLGFGTLGEKIAYSVGMNFTPHVINVNPGEDVTMKIMHFSLQGSQAICILAATGIVSSVTLRQPATSGGTLTYEGRFEIISLSGSFMLNESGGPKSRAGGMSVSLAGQDGRVVGGGLAGLLVASSLVQVVVGSFLAGPRRESKVKQREIDLASELLYPQMNSIDEIKTIVVPIPSFPEDNRVSPNPDSGFKTSLVDNKPTSSKGEPKGPMQANGNVSR